MFMTPSEFNFVACLRQELDQFSARTTSSDWLLLPPLRPRLRFLTHRTVEEVSSGLLQTRSVGVGDQRRTVVYCSQSSGRMEVSRESAVSTQACASPPLLTGGMERPGERRALRAPRAPIAVYVPPGRRSSSTTATTAEKASTQSKAKSRGSSDSAASTGTSSTTVAVAEKSKPSMQSKARSSRGSSDSAASIGDSLSAAAAAEKSKPSTQRKAKSSRGSSASTTSTMPSLSKTKPPDVPAAATVAAACVTEPSTASAECDSRHAAKKTRQSGSKAPPKKSLPKDEEREDTRPVERYTNVKLKESSESPSDHNLSGKAMHNDILPDQSQCYTQCNVVFAEHSEKKLASVPPGVSLSAGPSNTTKPGQGSPRNPQETTGVQDLGPGLEELSARPKKSQRGQDKGAKECCTNGYSVDNAITGIVTSSLTHLSSGQTEYSFPATDPTQISSPTASKRSASEVKVAKKRQKRAKSSNACKPCTPVVKDTDDMVYDDFRISSAKQGTKQTCDHASNSTVPTQSIQEKLIAISQSSNGDHVLSHSRGITDRLVRASHLREGEVLDIKAHLGYVDQVLLNAESRDDRNAMGAPGHVQMAEACRPERSELRSIIRCAPSNTAQTKQDQAPATAGGSSKKNKKRRKKKSDKAAEPVEDWETAEVDDLLAQMDMGAASACVTRPSRDLLAASSIEDIFYDTDEFGHVLEVYDFDSSADSKFINQAVLSVSINNNFHIKWVDDTHCLASFSSQHAARDALSLVLRGGCGIQMRPLSQASEASRAVAARSFDTDFMAQTSEPRPAKTAMVARRMISSALNTKIPVSQEARDKERQTLKDAREKKKEVAKKKADVWGSD